MMFSDHEAEEVLSALSAAQCLADMFDQKIYLMRDLSCKFSISEDCIGDVLETIINKSDGVDATP